MVPGRQLLYKLAHSCSFPENHKLIMWPHSPTLASSSVLKTLPKKKDHFVVVSEIIFRIMSIT